MTVSWGVLSTARINRLVLAGARASDRVEMLAVASRDARRAEAYAREDVDALIRLQAEFVYTEENAAELRRMFVARCQGLPRETILGFYDPDPSVDVTPILGSIGVPVLVAHGREDRIGDFAAAEYIAAHLPDARLYAFEGKGHSPMFSATDEFCKVLKRFVRTGDAGEVVEAHRAKA
jgi:pimeloyl-ACP methyl ester carboxylesterase